MKKTLIAVAALVATGAFAQSSAALNQPGMNVVPSLNSMSISGMIDAGYAVTTASTGVVTNNVQSTTASRLRFVGVSDLGGGMKSTFWFEMQPGVTDGTVAAQGLFNRGAWAGIAGGFGEVRLGRQGTNTVEAVITPDIQQGGAFYGFSGGGFLFNGMGGTGGQGNAWFAANPTRGGAAYTTAPGNSSVTQASSTANVSQINPASTVVDATRYDRAIRYSTPTVLGGLTLHVTTAYGTSTTAGQTGGGGGSQGFNVNYIAGPMRAVLAYQRANAEATDVGGNKGSLTTGAVNYDFGSFILGGALQSEKASGSNIIFSSGKSFGLAAYLPLGAARPYVKLGNHSYDTLGTNAKMFNIGSTYNLSKTTLLYIDYAQNTANLTGAGTGTVAAGNVVAAAAAASPKLIVVGTQINF